MAEEFCETVERGMLIAENDGVLSAYPINMTQAQAVAMARYYLDWVERTEGMTEQ